MLNSYNPGVPPWKVFTSVVRGVVAVSFYKLRQKKMVARYIVLPLAPLPTEAPNGDTPAHRIFFVDNTNIIKFLYIQSD